MNKIQKVSRFFRVLFQIGFYTLPIYFTTTILLSIYGYRERLNVDLKEAMKSVPDFPLIFDYRLDQLVTTYLFAFVMVCISMYILRSLINLFRAYERMDIFSFGNVKLLRDIGFGLAYLQVVKLISIFYLMYSFPVAKSFYMMSMVMMGIQSIFGTLGLALMIILASWIMVQAYQLREDVDLTI